MSGSEHPYIKENASQFIMDVVDKYDTSSVDTSALTPGELKRIELMRMMKEDSDKVEYLWILYFLQALIVVFGLWYMYIYASYLPLIPIIFGFIYIVFLRQRLRHYAQRLLSHKDNFDTYLFEGFSLKEMRYNAVKFAYLVFFPFAVFFIYYAFFSHEVYLPWWLSMVVAFVISGLGWLWYFKDDAEKLSNLESDLNSLQYLK